MASEETRLAYSAFDCQSLNAGAREKNLRLRLCNQKSKTIFLAFVCHIPTAYRLWQGGGLSARTQSTQGYLINTSRMTEQMGST